MAIGDEGTCKFCGEPLVKVREGQVFCSTKTGRHCRIKYAAKKAKVDVWNEAIKACLEVLKVMDVEESVMEEVRKERLEITDD